MKKKQQQQSAAKPLPAEAMAAFQDCVHDNSVVVKNKRELALFEIRQVDDSISALEGALRERKRRRRMLVDRVSGMTAVLSGRHIV